MTVKGVLLRFFRAKRYFFSFIFLERVETNGNVNLSMFTFFSFAVLPDGQAAQLDRAATAGALFWVLVRPKCPAVVFGRVRGSEGTLRREPHRLCTHAAVSKVSENVDLFVFVVIGVQSRLDFPKS